jgi:methionine-rich copper-binding protein CopC
MASSGTVAGTGGTGSGYYWHNIMDLGNAADTVAPTVGGVAPADGTTDAAATSNVEANFSEAMDPATISDSTFKLAKQGSSQSVTATVSYDAATKKATLDPSTDLDPGATYVATVKGGLVGVKDLAGNQLAVDKSWSFSTAAALPPPIDITAPETTIGSAPSGTTNVADATFTFSSSEAEASFECRLDGEAYSACTSPKSYTNLSDGSHTLQVRATDTAGNTDATPANYTWTVDITAPTLSGVTPADGATNVAVADNIEANFSEAVDASTINGSTFTLVKQGSSQPMAAHATYDAAAKKATLDLEADLDPSATYAATVKGGSSGVKDSAGNPLAGDTTWSFTTAAPPPPDTTPPETTIDSGPSGTLSSNSASFTFSSDEAGGTFECKLDAGTFAACTTPKAYDGLSNGSHTFEVRAIDVTGNSDATPASRTWMVDTAAPVVQPPTHDFVENDNLGASTVPVKLTWSATDDSGVSGYQLQQSTNGGASYQGVALPSGTATTITRSLTPGDTSYQFRVRAQDQAGNWSSWTSGAKFGVGAYQESDAAINYVGLWTTQTDSAAYGGALRYANGLGTEKATFVFTGSGIGWVSGTNQSRGQADVYLDGTKVATIDLYSASGKSRVLVFSKGGLNPLATHTLEVRALGTRNAAAKSKRVDLDAFVVLR